MTYTREEIDVAIQAAAAVNGEPLSMDAYREFRSERGGKEARIPTPTTISTTEEGYESWTAACEANDVEPYTRGAEPSVSIADRVRALREAASELGEPLGFDEYQEWAKETDAPTVAGNPHVAPHGIGSWADWCHVAGVEPKGKNFWTPVECLFALRHADDATEGLLSRPTYDEWRAEQDGLYPGKQAFTRHWPTFTAARAIALGERKEVPPEAWEE